MSRICAVLYLSTAFVVGNAGCGDGRPSLVPVTGILTLNGEPVADAQVGFQPQGIAGYERPSLATTDSQGRFVVGTYDKEDGLPVGKYVVTVFKREAVSKVPENYNSEDVAANTQPVRYQWTVPRQYSDAEESGLTVEVTSSGMTPETLALTGEPELEVVGGRSNDP